MQFMTGTADGDEPLTPVERRIADLLIRRWTHEEIADKMFLGLETVQRYVDAVMTKLAVENRDQLEQRLEGR